MLLEKSKLDKKPAKTGRPKSIYKRFRHSIIPPLSFLNLGTSSPSEEPDDYIDDEETNEDEETNDDEDTALAIGGLTPLNNFVNMLTSILVYSGKGDLKKFRQTTTSDNLKQQSQIHIPEITTSEEEEDEGDSEIQEEGEENEDIETDLYDSDEDEVEEIQSTNLKFENSSNSESLYESARRILLDTEDGTSSINPSERTPFQKSVLKNFDPLRIEQTQLLKLKDIHLPSSSIESDEFKAKKEQLTLKVAEKLKIVFDLKDDDYFYGNYNVWLIKDVLLQGHVYLTRDSILFFTFLPKRYNAIDTDKDKNNDFQNYDDSYDIIQTGSLGMKTAQYGDTIFSSVITHRFWAILRPETLTIYTSPTDLYFPTTVIDLKSCISVDVIEKSKHENVNSPSRPPLSRNSSSDTFSAEDEAEFSNILNQESANSQIDEHKENTSGGIWFKVVTKKKIYKFHCDSLYSARQWVNNIIKVSFQLHNSNSNNEVITKIPICDVLDLDMKDLFEVSNENDFEEDPNKSPKSITINHLQEDNYDVHTLLARRMKRELKKRKERRNLKDIDNQAPGCLTTDTCLLLFNNGDTFYNTLHEIVKDGLRVPKKSTDSDRLRFFNKFKANNSESMSESTDTTKIGSNSHSYFPRTISTLSSHGPQNGIIDQMMSANRSPTSPNCGLTSPGSFESNVQAEPPLPQTVIKKLGKTLSPSSIFSKNKPEEYFPDTDKSTSDNSGACSPNRGAGLPKHLSLSGLKDINMAFEASYKKFDVHDGHNDIEEILDRDVPYNFMQSKAQVLSPNLSSHESISPTPLNLTDPSENREIDKKKQNKLISLGKSIKAISLTNKWGAINHFELVNEDDNYYVSDITTREVSTRHFQEHFSFNNEKKLVATYYAHIQRALPIFGKVYLGVNAICFRSLLPGVSTKMILPLSDVDICNKEKGRSIAYYGLVIIVRGYEELFLEFNTRRARNDCLAMVLRQLERVNGQIHNIDDEDLNEFKRPTEVTDNSRQSIMSSKIAQSRIENARLKLFEDKINSAVGLHIPIILEDSPFYKTEMRPSTSFNFTLLTIGSRGDVQPYIALGKGLIAEGHNVTIATHVEFEEWILKHGMKFKPIAGDPAELMSLMVNHGSMSVSFFKEASTKFRGWITDLLTSSWKACQGTDILIESPSAMGGAHIAEALGIPYMRAFTMPWTRTRAYPHAFIVPDKKKGGSYNYLTHVMFENVFWKGICGQVNKWRVEELGLPKTNLYKLAQSRIPFLYNISPTIFPPSVDFPDWVKVTGYWFLDEGNASDYKPLEDLVAFMNKAQADGKKIVYIGFGSIVVNDAKSLTKAIVDAVLDSDVRCILNKGWSDTLTSRDPSSKKEPEIELPSEVLNSGAVPHDWLFPRVDAAVHHGGSGTTGATLRAGIPTIIKPFFGDQFFYASRIEGIGVGLGLRKLNSVSLSKALKTVTSDTNIIEKAKKFKQRIKREHGVKSAIEVIYYELEYARSLIVTKQMENARHELKSGSQTPVVYENSDEDFDQDDLYLDSEYASGTHADQNELTEIQNSNASTDDATIVN